jgi:predicted PurR-regulated permease PerM
MEPTPSPGQDDSAQEVTADVESGNSEQVTEAGGTAIGIGSGLLAGGSSGAAPGAKVVVPRWIQLVLLPLALLGMWDLGRTAGSVFVVLVGACVVALILNPIAKHFQRVLPRGLSVLASYLLIMVLVGALIFVLANPVANQVDHFANNFPQLVKKANTDLGNVQNWFNKHGIKIHIKQQGQTALESLQKHVLKSSGSIVSFTRDVLGQAVTIGVDIVLTFVLSVYLLVYAGDIGDLVRRALPAGDGTPDDDYPLLVQRAVSGYVRGQLLFSVIMGTSAGVCLWLTGVTGLFPDGNKFGVFFGVFYGLMELIPYIGPILGAVPPVVVALVTHPLSAVWLVIMFVLLQQLEGHIVAPQVFRISLRINPILVILALLIGNHLYGIVGALLALPCATVIRATILYLRAHLVLERWGTPPP